MIPEDRLSTTPVPAAFVDPVNSLPLPQIGYEMGGVNINDPSQGMRIKLWTASYDKESGDVWIRAQGSADFFAFNDPDLTELDLAFDQNMQPFVAFMSNGSAKYWWYDPLVPGMTFATLPAGSTYPRCTLDDKRETQLGDNDVVLAYVRGETLYARQQHDRYTIEYTMRTDVTALHGIGMNRQLRLQFLAEGLGGDGSPWLGDVVKGMCLEAGIPLENINVDELYNDKVPGVRADSDGGMSKPIEWLQQVFYFDKADIDRKLHFPKRGREAVARIPYRDLVQESTAVLKKTIVDETKLPKLVNINHLDPDGGFAKNKQTAQRRSNTINAKGTITIDTTVVLSVDQAATAAYTLLKQRWNEQMEYEFSTRLKYSWLTVGDVVEVEDADGVWHRIRLEERNEDSGTIDWDGIQDAGTRTYGPKLLGNPLPPPISTTPGLAGPTRLEVINVSPNRDQDDELGLYLAAAGESSAWSGYQLLLSTDQGTSYTEAYRSETPCVLGDTLTDLLEEVGYEYQSAQTVEVTTNYPLASVSYEQLLGNQNRCIIGDEELQFQTVTLLGMVGTLYHYRLSGLIRARYNTPPEHWPMGTRFILMDESVIFARLEQWMIGVDLWAKAVTFNTTEDETVPLAYLYDEPWSQTEWPVSFVETTRDGSDNVDVSWIGRARLGLDTVPYHSKYMTGYRVKFSNDHTIDVGKTVQTATYASAPPGLTVQVCALNSITGEGPYSAPIAT